MAALEEQELEWGSQKRIQREQEDRNTGSWVQKIKGPVASKKREQEDNKGARTKRRKYAVEQEDWGEPNSQEQISECSTIEYTTFWELPPKESKQKSITDYMNTPEEVPLEPAGIRIPTENWTDNIRMIRETECSEKIEIDNGVRGGKLTIDVGICGPVSNGVETENVENVAKKCSFTKKGVCQEHQVPGKKLSIPSKVWKDRGGGRGFGYVSKKSTRYICMVEKNLRRESNISTRDVSDINNAGLSENTTLGATGIIGQGDYLEHSRMTDISRNESEMR